jgi:hypothetical protein
MEGPLTLNDPRFLEKTRQYRYNIVYGDFHAASVGYDRYYEAWNTPL